MEQTEMFPARAIEPELKELPKIPHRAGTHLDHRWTHKIMANGKTHGLYDEHLRLFQAGGVLSKFIYWKYHLVSLDAAVWRQVIDKVDWLEIVDHERNECLRIAAEKARKHAQTYNAGIGERIGVPMDLWITYDAQGKPK